MTANLPAKPQTAPTEPAATPQPMPQPTTTAPAATDARADLAQERDAFYNDLLRAYGAVDDPVEALS